jgi:hypothetical protein
MISATELCAIRKAAYAAGKTDGRREGIAEALALTTQRAEFSGSTKLYDLAEAIRGISAGDGVK